MQEPVEHQKIIVSLWTFRCVKAGRCSLCKQTREGLTFLGVVLVGADKFTAGKLCDECYPKMQAFWGRNEMIVKDKSVEVASTGQKETKE